MPNRGGRYIINDDGERVQVKEGPAPVPSQDASPKKKTAKKKASRKTV